MFMRGNCWRTSPSACAACAARGASREAGCGGDRGGGGLMLASLGRTIGLSLNFIHMTALVRHPAKPANNFDGNANGLLTYQDPSPKAILLPSGTMQTGTTLRTDYDVAGAALGLLV